MHIHFFIILKFLPQNLQRQIKFRFYAPGLQVDLTPQNIYSVTKTDQNNYYQDNVCCGIWIVSHSVILMQILYAVLVIFHIP